MRSLRDFKVPDFKFPKFKLLNFEKIEDFIDEVKKKGKNKENKPSDSTMEPPRYETLQEVFNVVTDKYKDNVLVTEKFDRKGKFEEITYGQFKEDVIGLGTGLIEYLGLRDKRVVIISETTYNWYVSYMAMLCGVGIAVPMDKELPANELENLVKRSKASAIIFSSRKKELIEKVKPNLPDVEYFIEMYSDADLNGKDVGFNTVKNIGKKLYENGNNSLLDTKIDKDEFKVLIFTSGTTSASKGVMLCNRNLAENLYAVGCYVNISEKDRLFSVLPLHHTYESTIGFLYPFSIGASVAVCEGLKYIVPNLKETKPTAMLAVPLLVESLYKKINLNIKKSGKEPLVNTMIHVTNALKMVGIDVKRKVFAEILENLGGNLKYVVSAAAPIDGKVGKWVEDIGIEFYQGYGLTETAPIAALTPQSDRRVGSVGKAIATGELKIDNPNEDGEGEILIKTPTLMLGYYENEEATNEVIKDGWFYSGDIGYMDKDGFLYITGRSKNVIVTANGKNIYPEEIELLLSKVPLISECMVYGKGENEDLTIAVKVIPNYEYIKENVKADATEEEIYNMIWDEIKTINHSLTSYKAIKLLEIKKDEFEKTTTMKIKRFAELKKDKEKEEAEKAEKADKKEKSKKEDKKKDKK
ncbi:MAG: AMP-binding protein [Clostridia bacterium]|nr:AMP-binding protein [Clostridia bacterium]